MIPLVVREQQQKIVWNYKRRNTIRNFAPSGTRLQRILFKMQSKLFWNGFKSKCWVLPEIIFVVWYIYLNTKVLVQWISIVLPLSLFLDVVVFFTLVIIIIIHSQNERKRQSKRKKKQHKETWSFFPSSLTHWMKEEKEKKTTRKEKSKHLSSKKSRI